MLVIVVFLLAALALAALVLVYVAFPHRGREVPAAPWMSPLMRRGVASLPTLGDGRAPDRPGSV